MAARRMVPVALFLLFLLSLSGAFHSSSVVRIRRSSAAAVRCRSVPQDSSWKARRNYFVVGRHDSGSNDNNNNGTKKKRAVALWKQRKVVATMATAVLIWMAPRPARADHPFLNSPASEKVGPRVSARPGATLDMLQQERQRRGSAPSFEAEETDTGVATMDSSGADRQHSNNNNDNQKRRLFRKNRKRRATRHDDLHLLDDDDDDSGDDDIKEESVAAMRESMATTTSTHSRGVPEEKVSTRKVSKLSGRHTNLTPQQRNRKQTQVFLSIFGPIALVCFVRETVRWNWEQRDVKRGIAVVEAQRMEYYNTTQPDNTADDNDEDDDDEDDDDDDDEEGDDEEEEEEEKKRPRGGPRKPTPPGGNNNGGGGGEGSDKPSAEDLDRLNRLFGKS